MSLNVSGYNISDIYVGDDKIDKIFVGDDLVYTSTPSVEPYYLGFHPNDASQVSTLQFYRDTTSGSDWSKFVDPIPVDPTFYYSYDCITWQVYTLGTVISIGGNNANAVYFKGDNLQSWHSFYLDSGYDSYTTSIKVRASGSIYATGNIMSLLYSDPSDANNSVIPNARQFYMLFYYCTALTKAPAVPATTLTEYCYYYMFNGASLTEAPALPATTLANSCYVSMFANTPITKAPELPATTLANSCYSNMFFACASLTEPPALPATTLALSCYSGMFYSCKSLTCIPELPVLNIPSNAYENMFRFSITASANSDAAAGCIYPYRIPSSGEGTAGSKSFNNMFNSVTEGNAYTPSVNSTFYINVPVME